MKKVLIIMAWILCSIVLLAIIGGGYLIYKVNTQLHNGGKIVEWSENNGRELLNLQYGEQARNNYDLYIPKVGKPNALMLFIHGGSWISGQKEDIAYEARRYAQHGYITATMNYSRLGTDTINSQTFDKPSIFSMMSEITMAITAIKNKCAEMGYNLTQMAIGGYSAGGHLAMLYATKHNNDSPLPIKFQISWVGPSDMNSLFPSDAIITAITTAESEQESASQKGAMNYIHNIIGHEIEINNLTKEHLDSLKSNISPIDYVNTTTPPAILAYGAIDKLVNAEHGRQISSTLSKNGIENKLFVFPNSGHELGNDTEYTLMVERAILEFCTNYFE